MVAHLREDVIPEASVDTQLQVYVGGSTATSIDLSDALIEPSAAVSGAGRPAGFPAAGHGLPQHPGALVGAITNLTSILVGLGAITAVFQLGYGSRVVQCRFRRAGDVHRASDHRGGHLFGLSMDYQVFLVSRMHEEWTTTHDNRRAIRVGLSETARVIATAAMIMLAVFASFSFTGERIVSAIGIGLASAVVVDAFVVRLTLVPAIMTLLGDRNWSYPRWAERITPRLSVEGTDMGPLLDPCDLTIPTLSTHR